ncbi:MAG: GNAT family N-acetyltransferase [Sphaerochaetaceae bacterium]
MVMDDVLDPHMFMMCESLDLEVASSLDEGYSISLLQKDELPLLFDLVTRNRALVQDEEAHFYYDRVFRKDEKQFFSQCYLLRDDQSSQVIGSIALWKAYNVFHSIQWFSVERAYREKGLARSLFSHVVKQLSEKDMPLYFHSRLTHFQAVNLFLDFGGKFIKDQYLGNKENGVFENVPALMKVLPLKSINRMQFVAAPQEFLDALSPKEELEI